MNDKSDYTAILGNTGGIYPSKILGRGIYREKEVYEFQTACVAEKPEETIKVIQKFCEKLKGSGQKKAKRIPVMPKVVYQKHVEDVEVSFENIPIGLNVDTAEPVCINLKKRNVGQVLAMDKQDIVAFAEGLAQMLQQMFCGELYVIDVGKALTIEGMDKEHYVTEKPEEIIVKLFQITRDRNNEYKKSNGEATNAMYEHPIIVMLMGVGQIKRLLSEDGKDKLRVILEKTSGKYGLFFWAVDDYQSSNSYNTETWCNGDGIWIGKGIGEQIRFRHNRLNTMSAKNIDFTKGFLMHHSNTKTVKLLISERMGREVEEEDE